MKATRWRRYGQDRTYFKSDSGRDLGWIDNVSGHVEANSSDAATEIRQWAYINALTTAPGDEAQTRVRVPRSRRGVTLPIPASPILVALYRGVLRLVLGLLFTAAATAVAYWGYLRVIDALTSK